MEIGEQKELPPFVATALRNCLHRHYRSLGGIQGLKKFIADVVASFDGGPEPDTSVLPKWLLEEYRDAKNADYIRYQARKKGMFEPKQFYNWLFPADPTVLADRDFFVEKRK